MAKNKGGNKKSAAKKPAAKAAVVKEETPAEEPQVDNGTVEETPVAPPVEELHNDEGTNEGSGEVAPPVEEPTPNQEPEASLPPEDNSPAAEETPVAPEPVAETLKEETWKDRVLAEARELKIKMDALKAAVEGNKVPASEVGILNEQYQAMHAYYVILNRRLS